MKENNEIADAFYDEDYKELERLTWIKAKSQYEFEQKFEKNRELAQELKRLLK